VQNVLVNFVCRASKSCVASAPLIFGAEFPQPRPPDHHPLGSLVARVIKKIKLLTNVAAQDALHLAEQAVKRSSSTVRVDRKQLINRNCPGTWTALAQEGVDSGMGS
jgi:hypothetical protein